VHQGWQEPPASRDGRSDVAVMEGMNAGDGS